MKEFLPRHCGRALREFGKFFKVVLLVGPRQSGKSTLLSHLFPSFHSFVFDPVQDLYGARTDPDLFLDSNPPPLILDEIQYAPELLPAIKRRVDRIDGPGQYFLTGSQNLSSLRTVAESMAGRVGILELGHMTESERAGFGDSWQGVLHAWVQSAGVSLTIDPSKTLPAQSIFQRMWRGGMPGLIPAPDNLVHPYLASYVQTYLERDVRLSGAFLNIPEFGRFLRLSAALNGQEINLSQLGRELGMQGATARRWLDWLSQSYQWIELPAWSGNTIKRISSRPKGYLSDTGLAAYLLGIQSAENLSAHPAAGSLFEGYVVHEIYRRLSAGGSRPILYHWRTNGGAEVDLVIQHNGKLLPVEIKLKSNPTGKDTRGLQSFRQTYPEECSDQAILVHAGRESWRINDFVTAVSIFQL